jgi:hypothetical protein
LGASRQLALMHILCCIYIQTRSQACFKEPAGNKKK